MTRILVTGGAGYIGAHTCKALAQGGFTPVTFDNLSSGKRDLVKWGPLIAADLADRAAIDQALTDVAAVIHFAGAIEAGQSVTDPARFYRSNVVNSLNLLDAMQAHGIATLVFSSSAAVYGLPDAAQVAEDHPLRPINPYGETKLVIERTLPWYGAAYGLRAGILRYFNAAGADPEGEAGECHEPETHLVPLAIAAALGTGPALKVFGTHYPTPDGTAVRDYVHVSDLAEAHVLALRHLLEGGGGHTLNLGTGRGHSARELIAACARHHGAPVPHSDAPPRPGDPAILVANPAQAQRLLGWRARRPQIDQIVGDAYRWAKRHAV
jgi:UDP-glucose-4-epimerase GalE